MYMGAISFYREDILLKDLNRHIVFADNSGWDLSCIKACVADCAEQVEFISLPPEGFNISKGKGYNEVLMINAVLEKSAFIKEAGAFMKVTGRYPVYNIDYFLKEAENFIFKNGGSYYGDMKDHCVYDILFPHDTAKWNGHAAYTVLFATTVDFYQQHLSKTYAECCDSDGNYIECVWYRTLSRFRNVRGSGVSLRFRREPVCGGMQGSVANTMAFSKCNDSLKSRAMRVVGNGIRLFAPWFWF